MYLGKKQQRFVPINKQILKLEVYFYIIFHIKYSIFLIC